MPAALRPGEASLRLAIRVRPGASRTAVGGSYGDGPDAPIVVAVTARAVDGAANEAALKALGKAIGVPERELRLISGWTSRTKVVEISRYTEETAKNVAKLRVG